MDSLITLSSDRLSVTIDADYGARLVNVLDKQANREWLTQGPRSANTAEDARYASPEAVGWDECFPTVSACDARATAWGRRLRDHGDLWGRKWDVVQAGARSATLRYDAAEYSFTRTAEVDGPMLTVHYAVTEKRGQTLPYLWALHALLAVTPGDRILLPGLATARPTYLSTHADARAVGELAWHGPNHALPFALEEVQPRSSGFAAKFLASGAGGRAQVGRAGAFLDLAWDDGCPAVGLWLTYGGWPAPGGHQEIAIEPTSAEADDMTQAMAAGAAPLGPHETRRWTVSLRVSA